jgi:O-antigen ligase
MQRVDFEDVTSFNGRAYLWEIGMNWLMADQRGLLFGNGIGGQYFLDLLTFYARLWSAGQSDLLHFHSSSLEILVGQGIFGYVFYLILLYKLFVYYRGKYIQNKPEGDFFPAIVFLLFLLQLDTFVYVNGLGFLIVTVLLARACVKEPAKRPEPVPEELLVEQNGSMI